MAHAVQKHNDGENVRDGAEPSRVAKGEGSEEQENGVHDDEAGKPVAILKRRHGIPGALGAQSEDRGVVEGKKAGESFVSDVQTKGKTESEPRVAEVWSLRHAEIVPQE